MNNNYPKDLFVIGTGQMRTGTLSLKVALERLYEAKCYHMVEINKFHPEHFQLWISIFNNGKMDKDTAKKIFSGYCATVDFPSVAVYKDLIEIYPNAKVILTTRNSDDWIKSVKNTTMKYKMNRNFKMKVLFWFFGRLDFLEFYEKMLFHVYGKPYELLMSNDELLKRCYEDFNEEVRRYIPNERLLDFQSEEGWEPLCTFLNLPIPNEPYPFVNTTEQFNKMHYNNMFKYCIKFTTISIVIISGITFFIRKLFRNNY